MAAVEPLSASSLLLSWSPEPVAIVLLSTGAALYAGGVRRLRHRGRRWPTRRSASFTLGLLALVVATQSGIATYDTELFSVHVVQHVLLGMVAPVLLVLGAPVTLLLQAAHRPTQVNVVRLLRTRPARVVGHPLVAWVVFGGTLFVLYFSGLYELSLRNDVVHSWVHLHFIAVGCLFAWATIGLDPVPHRLPHGARLMLVLFMVPFHAFLGIALLSTTEPLAAEWYLSLGRTWGPTLIEDQRTGAAIMWIVGDVAGLVLGTIVGLQWLRADERRARRIDRALDAADARAGAGVW